MSAASEEMIADFIKGLIVCAVLLAPMAVVWWFGKSDVPDCETLAVRQQAFLLCVQTPSCTVDEYAFRDAFARLKLLKQHCTAPPKAKPNGKELHL